MPGRVVVVAGQRLEQERRGEFAGDPDLFQQPDDPLVELGVAQMRNVELAGHIYVQLLAVLGWINLSRGLEAGFDPEPGALDVLVVDDADFLAILRPGRPVAGRIVGDLDGFVEDRIGVGYARARVERGKCVVLDDVRNNLLIQTNPLPSILLTLSAP